MDPKIELNWWQLTAVQAGGIICLPVILLGHFLGKNYGWESSIVAIIAGNLFLFLISLVTSRAGIHWRKSTAELSIDIFGKSGKSLFAAAMVISMVGWFAIQTSVITDSVCEFLCPIVPDWIGRLKALINCLIGLAITLSSIKGMKSLAFIANVSLPVLILTLAYAVWRASESGPVHTDSSELDLRGISVVVAAAAAAVIDLPTFFKEGKSQKDGVAAAFLTFGILLPMLEFIGIYLYFHFEADNVISTLSGSSPLPLLKMWIVLFLVLAGWTTNNANLYSASVSLKPIMPFSNEKERLIVLGITGSSLSCFPIVNHMEVFLNVLGIVLGSMGAVMIIVFLQGKKEGGESDQFINFISWAAGTFCGLVFYTYKPLFSGIPFLDAFLVSLVMRLLMRKKVSSIQSADIN